MTAKEKVKRIFPSAYHERFQGSDTLIWSDCSHRGRLGEGKTATAAWKDAWLNIMFRCPHEWVEKTHYTTQFQVAIGSSRYCRMCGQTQTADYTEGRVGGPWRTILPKTIVEAEPVRNTEGMMCGLCDSVTAHAHRQLRCTLCNRGGLVENMQNHVCKPESVKNK